MSDVDEDLDLFSYMQPEKMPAPPAEPSPVVPEISFLPKPLSRGDFQQLAIGFLAALSPDAVATQVPVRRVKYQVTAAGFWRAERGSEVMQTAVVVLYEKLDHCFHECVDRDAMLTAIHTLRMEKEELERHIRETEPELASHDDLFSELRSWSYKDSSNQSYQKLLRKLEKLQHALHQGSRLEHIRRSGVADFCYLAVPAGLVAPDEIAAGWGLVYLNADRSFTLMRAAETQPNVTARSRQQLVQNMAVAASGASLFAAGVENTSEEIAYRRPPRRRPVIS